MRTDWIGSDQIAGKNTRREQMIKRGDATHIQHSQQNQSKIIAISSYQTDYGLQHRDIQHHDTNMPALLDHPANSKHPESAMKSQKQRPPKSRSILRAPPPSDP